jgi:hypothetical protein
VIDRCASRLPGSGFVERDEGAARESDRDHALPAACPPTAGVRACADTLADLRKPNAAGLINVARKLNQGGHEAMGKAVYVLGDVAEHGVAMIEIR